MLSRNQLQLWYGKRIFGLLTQAGTANPTFNTLNRSTIGTLTWARTGVGTYTLTGPAGSFPASSAGHGTVINSGVYDQATGKSLTGVRTSDTVLTFKHGIAAGAASDIFADVPVEILIF